MPSLPPAPTPSHDPESAAQQHSQAHPAHRPSRVRFVTLCQQLLVLGVILAVLTPATGIVSIDFAPAPRSQADPAPATSDLGTLPAMSMAAYTAAQSVPTLVPTKVVDPTVREVSLTGMPGQRLLPGALATAKSKVNASGVQRIISTPQKVTGYGAVGLTWEHGDVVPDDEIKVKVRLLDQGRWSGWTAMDYHDDHGPDPDSEEGKKARPGTDELLVGDVDQVQVKVVTQRAAPADMKLAVIDPGVATSSAKELPAIDTAQLDEEAGRAEPAVADSTDLATSDGDVALAAGAVTPKPKIFSRAQWGADEKMRDKSSLHYYEVHAGFVHHTVNANNYKAADVPAILRGIYAYHTRSRGWSDVGYNYLVDRFGRIWEGRAGGVDRPVVGAHTLGYNDDSFAMSAIGNYEETQPSQAMIEAYGALFAWKLSLHGVSASSTKQYVTSRNFQAINGHRDAASTACPGKYLYAKIPQIRKLAAQAQVSFAGRELESNIGGEPTPDIVVRRGSDGRGFTIALRKRADGRIVKGRIVDTGIDLSTQNRVLNAGDWDRDGKSDIITRRSSNGALYYRPGLGNGRFGEAVLIGTGFGNVKMLTAVGDMTGDGWPDLMGAPDGGSMRIYPGRGKNGLRPSYVAYSKVTARQLVGTGLWNGDGAPDVIARTATRLVLYPGNGPGGLTGAQTLDFDASSYNLVVGVSDLDGDGHADLLARKKNGQLFLLPGTTTGVGTPVLIGAGYNTFNLFS